MDHRFSLVGCLLALFGGSAAAGYAQVAPPPNWTTSAGASMYRAASNDLSFTGGVRGAAGVVNVGGRAITMPAAYRFAANAGQVAARAAFLNPALFVGVTALTVAYGFYTDGNFTISPEGGQWMKETPGIVCGPPTVCYEYRYPGGYNYPSPGTYVPSADAAAASLVGKQLIASHLGTVTGYTFPSGSTGPSVVVRYAVYVSTYWGTEYVNIGLTSRVVPAYDTTTVRPATEEEFLDHHQNRALPSGVPQEMPFPLPVEPVPILNPSPGDNPVPQPMRVPMGEPVPVPNSNPQQWKTPVVDLVPKPSSPWIVDLQPKDIIKEDATPLPDSEPVPVTPPAGQEEAPVTPDLCEKNPDILACQKIGLGSLDPSVITEKTTDLAITKDDGWGPENGSCPAPKTAVVMGVSLSLPFTMLCDFAAGIRPLLVGFAWLSAALTFIGFGRKD